MSNLEKVQSLVLLLSNNELDILLKTVNSILQKEKPKSEYLQNENVELFYKVINSNFDNMYQPFSILRKTNIKLSKRIVKVNSFLDLYLQKILELHNKKTKDDFIVDLKFKIILYNFYVSVMKSWFEKVNVPFCLKTLLVNYDKFPSLLERQFPGYIKSGLLVPFVLHTQYNRK